MTPAAILVYPRLIVGSTPRAFSPLLVGAVASAAAAALLWRMAVEPVDVGYIRYLGIADEMVRSGDWAVLRLVDHVYLDKPPLFFWLLALPIAVLGDAPRWVAHLPNLLALALSLACVHRLGGALYGRGEPALASALVFATTWETFSQASGKRLDPVFAALLTAGLTAFYFGAVGARDGRPRQSLLVLAFALLALATLTKGPVAILFFVLVAVTWSVWTGRVRVLVAPGSLIGLALLVGLVAAWPLCLAGALGVDELRRALAETSFTTRTDGIFVYLQALPVQTLPWSLFLPALAVSLWRGRPWRESDGMRLVAVWFVTIFAVLHLSQARHPRYLLPATPALTLSLLSLWFSCGTAGAPASQSGLAARLLRGAAVGALVLLALAGSLAGAALMLLQREPLFGHPLPPERWVAAPVALATAGGAWLAALSLRRGGIALRSPLPLALCFLGTLTTTSLLAAGSLRAADQTPQALAALEPVAAGSPTAILGLDEEQHQMTRLLARRAVPILADAEAVEDWVAAQPPGTALLLTSDAGRRELAARPGLAIRIARDFELAQEPVLLLEIAPGP